VRAKAHEHHHIGATGTELVLRIARLFRLLRVRVREAAWVFVECGE
jgi:hypothetical protein